MEEAERYLRFLHEGIRDCAFATIDGDGRPTIRIIDIMLHDRESVYFLTARGKDFYRQIVEQEFVAVTGQRDYRMVSLRGAVRPVDHAVIDEMFEQNPDMAVLYPGETRHVLEPFQLYAGNGEYLDLTVRPVVHETFAFGEAVPAVLPAFGAYRVTDACTRCGACLPACPQSCISLANGDGPAHIEPTHCLRCGACAETCLHNAIARSA